jgi:hypothetical protein
MTKTLKFIFTIILFLSLFHTTNVVSYRECKVDENCYEVFIVEDKEFLEFIKWRIMCLGGFCKAVM